LLVVALGVERGIVVDRAAEILVLLAPGSIRVLAAELHTGSNPVVAAHVLGRIGHPETLDALAKRWRMATRVRAESAAALAENQGRARWAFGSSRCWRATQGWCALVLLFLPSKRRP
jgi:RNA:NAD 2'-phosphotransferase (TPT1/KptA family)